MIPEHEQFTDRVRSVFRRVEDEAKDLNHQRMGTEHLLLGLIGQSDGLAAEVLGTMGVQLPEARSIVEEIVGRDRSPVSGTLEWTPRARMVIELSVTAAHQFRHVHVDTEHLLIGLLREGMNIPEYQGKGMGAGVLETMGLRLDSIHDETLRVAGRQQ